MSQDHCRVIDFALHTARAIASSNFYNAKPQWVAESCLALLLVNLKDALQLLHNLDRRISFNDEVENAQDVTDLVAQMRNAICHNGSALRLLDPAMQVSLSFATVVGQNNLMQIGDIALRNPHHDDVAFFYGKLRIFLARHIRRAIREGETALADLAKVHGYYLGGR